MKQFTFSLELTNKILAYLGRQQYADVFQLLNEIQTELQAQGSAVQKTEPSEETKTVTPEVDDEEEASTAV